MPRSLVPMLLVAAAPLVALSATAEAGSIFLTGHDPDFHATLGGNATGARDINTTAISFVRDAAFNPYKTATSKFLFVESNIPVPGGHTVGANGIVASGYASGTDFEKHDASTLAAQLALLGTKYDSIVIASDFGGILTQAELNILNASSAAIIAFLNNGGGLYAMAESNNGAGLTPGGGHYGFLPFVVSTLNLNQSESGFTVTPFGASLGLTNADVNGNASHNIFTTTGGMNIVDVDSTGNIMSLAVRAQVTTTGVAPLPPASLAGLSALFVLGLVRAARRRRISG